jgi:2-polyprenyl-6-methoxyphenol hydroxylase-like FAD-dependent oxidoreductase
VRVALKRQSLTAPARAGSSIRVGRGEEMDLPKSNKEIWDSIQMKRRVPLDKNNPIQGFHPDVRSVLEACPDCHKWAILEREPLSRWSEGRIVLLGDACHPMTPYMAQGAAAAIEDAAVLARCLKATGGANVGEAFGRYEAHRKPRTSVIQAISSANTWMKEGSSDTAWLYGYDAWNAPLDQPADHIAVKTDRVQT